MHKGFEDVPPMHPSDVDEESWYIEDSDTEMQLDGLDTLFNNEIQHANEDDDTATENGNGSGSDGTQFGSTVSGESEPPNCPANSTATNEQDCCPTAAENEKKSPHNKRNRKRYRPYGNTTVRVSEQLSWFIASVC